MISQLPVSNNNSGVIMNISEASDGANTSNVSIDDKTPTLQEQNNPNTGTLHEGGSDNNGRNDTNISDAKDMAISEPTTEGLPHEKSEFTSDGGDGGGNRKANENENSEENKDKSNEKDLSKNDNETNLNLRRPEDEEEVVFESNENAEMVCEDKGRHSSEDGFLPAIVPNSLSKGSIENDMECVLCNESSTKAKVTKDELWKEIVLEKINIPIATLTSLGIVFMIVVVIIWRSG